jgi:hypothetical protein
MDIEKLARILHDSGREAVERGKLLNKASCKNNDVSSRLVCIDGDLHSITRFYMNGRLKTRATGEKCPRCNGTGYEPFLEWAEITDEAREGRLIQARYINEKVIEPLEKALKDEKTLQR